MKAAARIKKRIDFDEFCNLVEDGQKADLIDGVIYMASPDNTDSAETGGWLYRLMSDFADEYDLGRLFSSRVACKLSDDNAPEPDILFIPKRRRKRILRGRIEGAPSLAVEIVSPDSIERDYQTKKELYERHGVREYWIIDEVKGTATFYRLAADGKFREVKPRGGIFRSVVLKGFWLRLEWLWPETRPLKSVALAEILRK